MSEIPATLIEQLYHHDVQVRKEAVVALTTVDYAGKLPVLLDALRLESDPLIREDITYAIVKMGHESVPQVVALLKDEQPLVRDQAAHVLGKIGHASAVSPLMTALEDHDYRVVTKAAFALQQIGDARAIPALIKALGHDRQEVQTMLVDALSAFGSAAVDLLMAATEDPRWHVREPAIEILGNIGDERALPALVKALQSADWRERFVVITALAQINTQESRYLIDTVRDDPDVRIQNLLRHLRMLD